LKLVALTTVVIVAFAANSLLNRAALADNLIGPAGFSLIRVSSGALMLLALLSARGRSLPRAMRPDLLAIAGLSTYLIGFSFAYVSLDAGLGALLLFGGVQATMFAGAVLGGERPPPNRWIGMAVSGLGLVLLLWPSDEIDISLSAVSLMLAAAAGWGVYSLIGRSVTDPLGSTAWNFVYSLPVVAAAWLIFSDTQDTTTRGVALAIASGAITSGIGYALWYAILPKLGATVGALTQLSVPVIAITLGALLLSEDITIQAVAAAGLVLGGIAIGTAARASPTEVL
jgi:drug/metabolite transporter (DMT)-like permease